ncbi:hypothetical protein LCGC14_2249120 [marine sediment metagenome]|uniref:Uncharacterized protein n=1 Tax=marine sediment metagenome TaxID=412755 RepID=A0A0F9FY31_9ZZZZ
MSYANSYITRAIAEARKHLNEPSLNAKYTDADVIAWLERSYMQVLGELQRNAGTPIVAKFPVTIAANTTKYILPPIRRSIFAIYYETATGTKIFYDSRSRYNEWGRNVHIEGDTLKIQTVGFPPTGSELVVEYIPDGTPRLHNGTCTLNADGDEVTFGATPNAGTLDTRFHAYTGSVLRIFNVNGSIVTGNYIQERMISSYDRETRIATLDVALDPVPTTDDGSILYEIAPAIHFGLDGVLAIYAAWTIAGIEGASRRAKSILDTYRGWMRNLRLDAFYSHLAEATKLRGDNYDNRRYRRI